MSTNDPHDGQAIDDDELFKLVGEAMGFTAPVPRQVIEAAYGAFTWRTIDAELAELAFDSALADAGTRAVATGQRELTFRASGVEIEAIVVDDPDLALEGQLIPPTCREMELAGPAGVVTASSDDLGRFRFDEIPPGPVRLGVLLDAGWVYATWVVLRAS